MKIEQDGKEYIYLSYRYPVKGDFIIEGTRLVSVAEGDCYTDKTTVFRKKARKVNSGKTAYEWACKNDILKVYSYGIVKNAMDHNYSTYELDSFYVIYTNEDGVPRFEKLKGKEYVI